MRLTRDLGTQVVALKQCGAVAPDGEVNQPIASRVAIHVGRQVVCFAAVHRPFDARPLLVLPGVATWSAQCMQARRR